MRLPRPSLLFGLVALASLSLAEDFKPVAYHLGQSPVLDGLSPYSDDCGITLSSTDSLLTVDYGAEVAGFPYIEVLGFDGPVQVEFKYSEAWNGLQAPLGDGPFPFAVTLANTYRIETFIIDKPGRVESYFLQGGLRWQSVRLLSNGTATLSVVGIRSSVSILPLNELPGSLMSSNELYNKVWQLGVRTIQSLCLEAGSQPSTWDITPEGALIRGQQTAQSAIGTYYGNYTLTFMTKILRGGSGWRVACRSNPFGPLFFVTATTRLKRLSSIPTPLCFHQTASSSGKVSTWSTFQR